MALPEEIKADERAWLDEEPPQASIVVTSRARFARNLAGRLFAPHAPEATLSEVSREIDQAFSASGGLKDMIRVDLGHATGIERAFLKEARLISREMENGGNHRIVYVGRDLKTSVMVNEEDHLRMQCFEPGLQIGRVMERLNEADQNIGQAISYSFHQEYGYLTACPTNVGTGLRVSAMMHLPGLALRRELEEALKTLPGIGLTVRGFYGEHSDHTGDFYQISNEVTLGRSVEEIERGLDEVVTLLAERETEARSLLLKRETLGIQDAIWRSYGILTHARKIDSTEAMKLLSRIRLGVDQGLFEDITDGKLNRLIIEIQPGHLILRHGASDEAEKRDTARADLIRAFLANKGSINGQN